MSLISDALVLEATAADSTRRLRVDTSGAPSAHEDDDVGDDADLEVPSVTPREQARAIAEWIYGGRDSAEAGDKDRHADFPGLGWLRQPAAYSDREWILEISREYRQLVRSATDR
jgi:hypothetical protein